MFTWQQSFSATDGLTPGGLFEATDLLRPFGSSLIYTHSLGPLVIKTRRKKNFTAHVLKLFRADRIWTVIEVKISEK